MSKSIAHCMSTLCTDGLCHTLFLQICWQRWKLRPLLSMCHKPPVHEMKASLTRSSSAMNHTSVPSASLPALLSR